MLPPESLAQLKTFLSLVKKSPQILNSPQLSFFKEFIESYGGVVPPSENVESENKRNTAEEKKSDPVIEISSEEEIESDVELDNTGVIESPDPIWDEDIEVQLDIEISEENMEIANAKKREGISLFGEGNYEKAVEVFTEAIKLNPVMSLLYAKRGQCYLQLNKPNACIRDCTKALSINPDNAAAYKFRGRAHRLLGHWLEAVNDLRSACKIDFDEQADEWLKEVTPNARKLEEHQRKYERLRAEREIKEKQERIRKAREANAKAAAGFTMPDFGAGAGAGTGTKPDANAGKGDFKIPPEVMDMFNDPEIHKCLEDPEVFAAFTDISSNPANLMKYLNNPKMMALCQKMSSVLGKRGFPGGFPGGGFPGGFPGGGFPGSGGGANPPPSGPNIPDDIGLD